MKKTAVILLNLGGPDSKNAVRPFLMNFFMDKNIIRLPIPFRCLIAWIIAKKRSKKEAGESYAELGGASPLLKNTKAQAEALQAKLSSDYKVFVCMRYWHPMSPQVVREVRDWGAQEILLLPLYPQYSTTTTRSSYEVWQKASFEAGLDLPTRVVCCYPHNPGFVQASIAHLQPVYEQAKEETGKEPRILFSAHGLPEKVIKAGDPYQWQCEESAAKIAKSLKIENLDWQICYQSRVGPQKWIGPSIQDALEKAAKDNVPVVVYPHAFTQEHVETLVELDIEYRHVAEKLGLPGYYRAQTVGIQDAFISGLAEMVRKSQIPPDIKPDVMARICPDRYNQCCMQEFGHGIRDNMETG